MHEYENYLGGGGGLTPTPTHSAHLKIKIAVTIRRGISKRSHEKIGDCEHSTGYQMRLLVWRVVNKTLKFRLRFLILLTIKSPLTATRREKRQGMKLKVTRPSFFGGGTILL